MKKLLFISLLIISVKAYSQINWRNYSTSFNADENSTSGIAIPYNGIYDNSTGRNVGFCPLEPQYKIFIDSSLNDSIHFFMIQQGFIFWPAGQ